MEDYASFKEKIADMDQRLAFAVCQAFDDCSCCESVFKVSHLIFAKISADLDCNYCLEAGMYTVVHADIQPVETLCAQNLSLYLPTYNDRYAQ